MFLLLVGSATSKLGAQKYQALQESSFGGRPNIARSVIARLVVSHPLLIGQGVQWSMLRPRSGIQIGG